MKGMIVAIILSCFVYAIGVLGAAPVTVWFDLD